MDFWLCPSKIFWKSMKTMVLVLGSPLSDRKCLGTKQTQVKTPMQTKISPIKLASHIQQQQSRMCGKSPWTSTDQNADGAPPWLGVSTLCRNIFISYLHEFIHSTYVTISRSRNVVTNILVYVWKLYVMVFHIGVYFDIFMSRLENSRW